MSFLHSKSIYNTKNQSLRNFLSVNQPVYRVNPGDLIRETDHLGSNRILSESDRIPMKTERIRSEYIEFPGNESTKGTLVSESLQNPTI